MTPIQELLTDMGPAKNGPFVFHDSSLLTDGVPLDGSAQHKADEAKDAGGTLAITKHVDTHQELTTDALEKGSEKSTGVIHNSDVVSWDGDDDPQNPKNWSRKAKWTVTLIMSAYDTITLMSSSMIAPALPAIQKEIHIESDVEVQVVFSVFILACSFGPLLFAPLSEIYGRKNIVQAANAWYIVWTLVCGFATSKSVMILGRFLSGFGASVVFGVAVGTLSDCWDAAERGKSLAILNFAPLLGPALGPVLGGFITQNTSWRWIFWSMAIADGALQMLATFFFRETYGPVILERKAARLRKETGNLELHVPGENHERSLGKKLRVNLSRPFIILATHPMAQISTIYGSVGFGILYIVLSSFASLWTTLYQQSASVSGLHYFSIVAGFTIGSQGCSYLMDRIWAYVSRTRKATPELRAALMPPGAFCWVVGLFIYGWGAQNRLHWLVPDIGAALYGLGSQLVTSSSAAYMTDIYGRYTASAMAGSFCVRALFAFSFPLFAPQMYQSLGYGWGNSLLAFVCAAMGCTIPWVIWKYGAILRAKKSVQDLH